MPTIKSRMSRKHFNEFANYIRAIDDKAQREQTAREYADKLAPTNPRFDRGRFIQACMK